MQRIIIVTGTPGVGKTVLAKMLARETGSQLLNIGQLVKIERLYTRFDRPTRSYVIDERRLRKRLNDHLSSQGNTGVVIETHWLGRFMPKRREMVAIVVRLDPLILARRLKTRGWPRSKIWDNLEAELIDLSLYDSLKFLGPNRVHQIDATGKRPGQLLRETMRLLSTRRGWNGRTPNWLRKYDPIQLSRSLL